MIFKQYQVHMVGIGGSGMCGIAEVLLSLGHRVTGSDLKESPTTQRLASRGAIIHIGHAESNVASPDVVVISSAVSNENPEVVAARAKKIPVIPRAEMLAELMRLKYSITIAGAHGKTSTTSMTGLLLQDAGLDPTIVIGGRLQALGSHAKTGGGDCIVVEADESDRSFLKLFATIAVITNIDEEHLDHYTDLEDIKRSFVLFANKVPFYGAVILCIDNQGNRSILPLIERKVVTYGLSEEADFRAVPILVKENTSEFQVFHLGVNIGTVRLNVPGSHNIVNSLAAIAVGSQLGISFDISRESLSRFRGADRRFQIKANANEILIIDDYAHHPSEIQATLNAARQGWNRRLVVVFQPHRYTRLHHLIDQFASCFDLADVLVLTDVYAAGEKPIPGVTIDRLASAMKREVLVHKELESLPQKVLSLAQSGDLVVFLGAGTITAVADRTVKLLMDQQTSENQKERKA
jgi:UDP-N-acetylmuramate--alanine ligase